MLYFYHNFLHQERKKGLTRKEFANKISEKESVIRRIEMEEMIPDEKLRRKIENFLDISLTEKYQEKRIETKTRKGRLTLGDVGEVE